MWYYCLKNYREMLHVGIDVKDFAVHNTQYTSNQLKLAY